MLDKFIDNDGFIGKSIGTLVEVLGEPGDSGPIGLGGQNMANWFEDQMIAFCWFDDEWDAVEKVEICGIPSNAAWEAETEALDKKAKKKKWSREKHGKKWLIPVRSISPVSPSAGFVPTARMLPGNVVVRLRIVGAIISSFSQVAWVKLDVFWQIDRTSHELIPQRAGIHASDD